MPATRSTNPAVDQPLEGHVGSPETTLEQVQVVEVRVARDISMPAFCGLYGEDGKRWFEMFTRFAACHCWPSAYKLMFVICYLSDNALVWFENQSFNTWEEFSAAFLTAYGCDLLRSRKTEEE